MVKEGVKFFNAYTNAANCAPIRAALVTGLYFPNQPIYHVGDSGPGPMIPAENAHELPVNRNPEVPRKRITCGMSDRILFADLSND